MASERVKKMKPKKLTLISLALLVTLLVGAIAIIVVSAPKELKLKVKWTPRNYLLDNLAPDPWDAELYFAPPRPLDEIDPETIRLEGIYQPVSAPYLSTKTNRLIVPFDGYEVLGALLLKAGHLAPGEYRILLEITGQLIDGTPFSGKGGINLIVPENPPP